MSWDRMALLAQAQQEQGGGIAEVISGVICLAIAIVGLAGMWKVFVKAGQPGWGVLIPIYNAYLMCKIGSRPGWWVLLFFIPCVGVIIAIVLAIDIAKNFGKGTGFGLGLAFLGFIFYPILGFGDAQYFAKPAWESSPDSF
jgi:hypothetical protein